MKKSLLLFSAVLLAGFTHGQDAVKSVVFHVGSAQNNNIAPAAATMDHSTHTAPAKGLRTTGGPGGGRWYDYNGAILANESTISCNPVAALSNTGIDLWNDTTGVYGYTGGTTVYAANDFVSVGLFFDPFDPTGNGWNNATNFPGLIGVSTADAYTIDSVFVGGWYGRNYANAAKDSVIDTIILAFTYGTITSTANYPDEYFSGGSLPGDYCSPTSGHVDFLDMLHDSLHNRAGNLSGTTVVAVPTTQVYKILLGKADTNESDDTRGTQYPRTAAEGFVPTLRRPSDPTIAFAVPAGNYASMSVTYKSGDATYPTTPLTGAGGAAFPGEYDTIRYSTGIGGTTSNKYNTYTSNIIFSAPAAGSTTANFPPYNWPNDHTSGFFLKENAGGWGGQYIPNWGWTTGGGAAASALQYPLISYHINCPTCYLNGNIALGVNNVKAGNNITVSPNPANNELTVAYSGVGSSNVTVSLTNMLGQVVATQKATNGTSVFNTSALSAGVYIYTVEVNGQRSTGRVVVSH